MIPSYKRGATIGLAARSAGHNGCRQAGGGIFQWLVATWRGALLHDLAALMLFLL
jgi:hypothetical protein